MLNQLRRFYCRNQFIKGSNLKINQYYYDLISEPIYHSVRAEDIQIMSVVKKVEIFRT